MTDNKMSSILLSITLIITGFATLVLGNYLVFGIAVATNPDWDGTRAYQTFTFSSNATCGDRINVTTINTAGNVVGTARFYMNFTTGCPYAPPSYTDGHINVSFNDAALTAITDAGTNLSGVMNGNTTITDVMTVTNGSSGQIILTYNSVGRIGNNLMSFAESVTNGSWTDTSLKNGKDAVVGQSATLNYASIVIPLMGLLLMITGMVVLLATVRGFSLNAGKGFSTSDTTKNSESNNSSNGRSSNSGEGRG